MKNLKIRQIQVLLFTVLFLHLTSVSKAQSLPHVIQRKGFWTVETNVKVPNGSIVRFYTDGAQLIYEEHLTKIQLNISRSKTRVLLNAALDEVLINWQINPVIEKKGKIVADLKRRGVDEQLYAGREK